LWNRFSFISISFLGIVVLEYIFIFEGRFSWLSRPSIVFQDQ